MRASAAVSAERAAYVRPTRIIFQGNAATALLLTIRKWEVEVEEEERRPFTMLPLWNRDAAVGTAFYNATCENWCMPLKIRALLDHEGTKKGCDATQILA